MENKYLFLFSHDKQITWYSVFAEGFKECGEEFKTVMFVHGKKNAQLAIRLGCYDIVYDLIDGFDFNSQITLDHLTVHKEILRLENEIFTSFFWEDIKTDRWARSKNNASFMIQYMNHSVSVVLKAYKELNPVAAFGEYSMALYRFVFRFFRSQGKPMLYPITTRYFERFYFETDIFWEWGNCMKLYNDYVNNEVPESIKNEIYPYYEKIIFKYTRPNYTIYKNNFTIGFTEIKKLSIRDIIRRTLEAFKPVDTKEYNNNIRYSIIENEFIAKLKRIVKERLNYINYNNLIVKELPQNIKYAVYFLHYQPEYTSDNLGKFYMEQQFLIKNIASSLPADTYLFVKEHPTMIGLRDKQVYDYIKSISNVILVNHTFDSIELIKHASIIFTIVGTPALEAMFIGKPAIMFGRYAFAQTNLISLCTDIWQLGKMVREKLNLTVSEEEVKKHTLALLAAKYAASRPGQIPLSVELIDSFVNNKEQYSLVKKSFQDELKDRGIV